MSEPSGAPAPYRVAYSERVRSELRDLIARARPDVLFIVVGKIVKGAEARLSRPVEAATKECPFCCEVIPKKAKRCKACTSELSAAAPG